MANENGGTNLSPYKRLGLKSDRQKKTIEFPESDLKLDIYCWTILQRRQVMGFQHLEIKRQEGKLSPEESRKLEQSFYDLELELVQNNVYLADTQEKFFSSIQEVEEFANQNPDMYAVVSDVFADLLQSASDQVADWKKKSKGTTSSDIVLS